MESQDRPNSRLCQRPRRHSPALSHERRWHRCQQTRPSRQRQQLLELTRDQGRNERPSWAPDGRHLVLESTRSGERQIWTMLADGSQAHQLTTSGHNESPNWSTH
ncbi:MAG: hypothetical protein DMG42_18980 [Acidobacteria bacterium]|nr:MAG: hypothetical protein DMG42_18980 [Acidobacteriota bacterium]